MPGDDMPQYAGKFMESPWAAASRPGDPLATTRYELRRSACHDGPRAASAVAVAGDWHVLV
jgi:hypothetical protein